MTTTQEYEAYLQQVQTDLTNEQTKNAQLNRAVATTMFEGENNDNLVKWQLDIKEELERIEHLLRKHIPKVNPTTGEEYFEEPDEATQLFNERGVQEILNILAWYLNKNIILSNFTIKEVQIRVYQFSKVINNFIFNNNNEFGLDTPSKIKHYPIIVMNIVNTVEAAYHRAIGGGERNSLRTARTVTQTDSLGARPMGIQPVPRKQFNLRNPRTWS